MRQLGSLGSARAGIASGAAILIPSVIATVFRFAGEDVTVMGIAMSFSATCALCALLFTLFQVPAIFALYRLGHANSLTLTAAGSFGGACTAFALSMPELPSLEFLSIELGMGSVSGTSFWLGSKLPQRKSAAAEMAGT